MEIFRNLIKDEKKFFEKYVQISLLLNALIVPLSGIYEFGLTLTFYGQIVGTLFLLTFFTNLGLIYLNDRYLDKSIGKERRVHLLTYGYLIFTIITITTLLVSSGVGANIKRPLFDPIYYLVWIFAFLISYFDYTILITKDRNALRDPIKIRKKDKPLKIVLTLLILLTIIFTGYFISNLLSSESLIYPTLMVVYIISLLFTIILFLFLPIIGILLLKYKWRKTSISLTIIHLLKIFLLTLSLITFIIAGLIAFNLLSGGAPRVFYLISINILLSIAFPTLILLLPVITVLIYKLISREWKRISKSLILIGIFFTISFSLPYLTAPVSIIDANNQFAEVFGKNWNKFDPSVEEEFLDMHHVLIQSWFGEPELDPDSWKMDSDNVYKETDDYRLKFDVYYPGKIAAQFIGKKSTIIYIHGGGWSSGHRDMAIPYMKYFAAQGYVCFTISYRLLETVEFDSPDKSYVGDYNIKNMMTDIANFTQYLAAYENEDVVHGADLDNIFIMGMSAGAHLAAVTGFGYNDDEWGLHQRLEIKGIVLFYPPNDVRSLWYEEPIFSFLYDKGLTKYKTPNDDPGFYDLYTPSKLVDDDDPPCLIFQGTSDSFVPYIHAEEIKKACKKEGVDVILVTNYFIGHSHDVSVFFKTMSVYYIERFYFLIKED